jgi:hypothetical protein
MFQKEKTTYTEYFLKKAIPVDENVHKDKVVDRSRYKKKTANEEEMNTTRQLKESQPTDRDFKDDRRGTVEPLTLKENIEHLTIEEGNKTIENVDHVDSPGSVGSPDSESNDTGSKEDQSDSVQNDIKIHNNFVAIKNPDDNTKQEDVHNNSLKIDPEIVKPDYTHRITMVDYETLNMSEMFVYDKRSFKKYLWDNCIRHNLLISIIFKHSLIDPIYIRIAKLVFCLSLMFGTNAMLFSDYYIELRANSDYKVKYPITSVLIRSCIGRRSPKDLRLPTLLINGLYNNLMDYVYPKQQYNRLEQCTSDKRLG